MQIVVHRSPDRGASQLMYVGDDALDKATAPKRQTALIAAAVVVAYLLIKK